MGGSEGVYGEGGGVVWGGQRECTVREGVWYGGSEHVLQL